MHANVKTAPTKRICSWSRSACMCVTVIAYVCGSLCVCVFAGDCVCSFHFICMAGAQSVSLEF